MKKRLLAIILSLVMVLSLAGCSGGSSSGVQMNEDGSIKTYTEEDIPEGLYIKSGDVCYPLLNAGTSEQNYQWFTSFDNLIPELKKGDTLIFYSNGAIPENFTFWKMIDFGYSVGIKFTQDGETKNLTFPSDEAAYCSYSPVGDFVLNTTFEGNGINNVSIKEVNGKEFKETMLTTDGFMKGLTKDAMYKFWYYQGTVYKSVNIKADTHIFIEDYDLSTGSYVELKEKVFEINLPAGLENGYWYIEGYGLLQYSGADTDFIIDSNNTDTDLIGGSDSEEPNPNENTTEETPQDQGGETPTEGGEG